MEMDDGFVLPHFLGLQEQELSGYQKALNDSLLRVGRVTKAYAPDDKQNINKRFIEYDVEVEHSEGGVNFNKVIYPRARIASLFGGVADFIKWTPRIVTDKPKKINEGSQVLLLCINGDTQQAVIIGGIEHPNLIKDDSSDGHNFQMEFNGVGAVINRDGELTITYRGATKPDGALNDDADAEAEGSTVSFKKDGSIELTTADDNQHIKLNHADKTLEIQSDTELHITSNGNVNIESAGVHLGGESASQEMLLGTTYRDEESRMNNELKSGFQSLMTNIGAAGAALTSAGSVQVIPVAGAIAAAPFIATAASQLISAVSTLAKMMAAMTVFEAQASRYKSNRHTLDE